jgi:hypothetical protein
LYSEDYQTPVKIGYTENLAARLAQLQTGSPFELYFHAVIDGGRDIEKAWHKRFAEKRTLGEWFAWDNELERVIHSAVYHSVGAYELVHDLPTSSPGWLNRRRLDERHEVRKHKEQLKKEMENEDDKE